MVAGVVSDMGWPQFLLHSHLGPTTRLPSVFRRCWRVGLWGYFKLSVVLRCLVCRAIPSVHHVQGAFPYRCSSCFMGPSVGVSVGRVPVQQRVCGGYPQIGHLPGPAVNVVAPSFVLSDHSPLLCIHCLFSPRCSVPVSISAFQMPRSP